MLGPKPEHVTTFLNPPHPASTAGLPQRKESDTMPTRESSSLDYLKAFILFCLRKKKKRKAKNLGWMQQASKYSNTQSLEKGIFEI